MTKIKIKLIAKKNPRLLLVGGRGYIGKNIIKSAASSHDLLITSSAYSNDLLKLDLSNTSEFDYSQIRRGDICLLAAAISSPDVCLSNHQYAWSVNVTGTSDFIARIMDRGARVIFFSSDTVYGQKEMLFDENSLCNPAGEYAIMKYEVEKLFLNCDQFKSIRLSYVFSHEDKFTQYLLSCSRDNKEAELFHPFFRAIVHREDVVEATLSLAQHWDEFPQPIINFGGPDVLSRLDFAEILRLHALPQLKYKHVIPSDNFFDNRPRTIAMMSPLLDKLLGRPAHKLADAVRIEKIVQAQLAGTNR
jgi:dTDP-4-dehydrorhamnose reductase